MGAALNSGELDALAAAVVDLEADLDAAEQHAALAMYGLLAGGHAVTARSLSERIGWPRSRAERFLDRFSRLEHDDLGRVVGFRGVSLRRTGHAVAVGHQMLYGWSAWDCLVLPLAVDAAALVRSTCPATGRDIELVVTPQGVRRRDPDTAVVSFRSPQAILPEQARGGFRAVVHFLADVDSARSWTARVPDALLLGLDEAFEVARRAVGRWFADAITERPP